MATPTTAITAWDESGKPIAPGTSSAPTVTAWDETGKPVAPEEQEEQMGATGFENLDEKAKQAQMGNKSDVEFGQKLGAAGTAASIAIPVAAAIAGPALADFAIDHLAGNVLPGLEKEAARQTLMRIVPKVIETAKVLRDAGIGLGGITYMFKTLMGNKE